MTDLDVTLWRGGTSKGVFVDLADLPADSAARDALLLRLMGSPDPMQLDGLGGTHSSTSKVVAVGASAEGGVDVDYLFAQVAVTEAVVDLTGNCGNLTAAVGPHAIDGGLASGPVVTLRNLNTGVVVRATCAVRDGRFDPVGHTTIDGVPGTGSAVVTDYLNPGGAVTGKLLPTGSPTDVVDGCEVSILDVTSCYAFVRAGAVGLRGDEAPADLNADPAVVGRLERLRQACGAAAGLRSAAQPRLVIAAGGREDLRILATSMGKVHHAIPGTAALCIAAAARLDGTVIHRSGPPRVRIAHPKGWVEATVELDGNAVTSAGLVRTARRLLTGTAHL